MHVRITQQTLEQQIREAAFVLTTIPPQLRILQEAYDAANNQKSRDNVALSMERLEQKRIEHEQFLEQHQELYNVPEDSAWHT